MIHIDGAEGEGGGQVVRNACALALVTGQPFRITHIRARRSKPGLMRQHVTAIEAACAIGGGDCEGLSVGASELTFRPGRVTPGAYRFAVGTAGSTSLVLQTVLIPLLLADAPSSLVLEGGTHNMAAPPFDFIDRTFLPLIRRMGGQVKARLSRHGFYPRGGGRIEVDIAPSALKPIELLDRGQPCGTAAAALIAGLPGEIAQRELAAVRKAFSWPDEDVALRQLPEEEGPGNILMLEARFDHVTELVSGFAQLGVPAEQVAKRAIGRLKGYLDCGAFAGPVPPGPAAAADGGGGRRRLHLRQDQRPQPHRGGGDRAVHGKADELRASGGREPFGDAVAVMPALCRHPPVRERSGWGQVDSGTRPG